MPPQEQGEEQVAGRVEDPLRPAAPGRPPRAGQFRAGLSGNPGGRPKGRSLTAILREALGRTAMDGLALKEGQTVGDALVEAMLLAAIRDAEPAVMKQLWERSEGKVGDVRATRTLDEIAADVAAAALSHEPDAPPPPRAADRR